MKAPLSKPGPNSATFSRSCSLFTLSNLIFMQLAELRHRGAFSAVAQAFAACCFRCHSDDEQGLLGELYQVRSLTFTECSIALTAEKKALLCIGAKGSKITRRSAGIPSIVTGLLAAFPEGPLFPKAMQDLTSEASRQPELENVYSGPLPQVHALNCLKAIFTHSALGPASEPYIPASLQLAARCLASNLWPIRNCGLMLFRALIDRLLPPDTAGSQNWSYKSKPKSSRLLDEGYFQLFDIIVKLLRPPTGSSSSSPASLESVFPALKLVQRFPLRKADSKKIEAAVLVLCGNAHWHVRDMAARTYASLAADRDVLELMTMLLPSIRDGQNAVHGRLLSLKYILTGRLSSLDHSSTGRSLLGKSTTRC